MMNLMGNIPPSSNFKQYEDEDPSVAFIYLLLHDSRRCKSLFVNFGHILHWLVSTLKNIDDRKSFTISKKWSP